MTFQIVCLSPVYCQITDGILGEKARPLPNAYETEALALKVAQRLGRENYESLGDDRFVVVPFGESYRRAVMPDPMWDDMPF